MSAKNGDVVYVTDYAGENSLGDESILTGFRILSASPRSHARMIGHPVEDGTKVFDNKVVEPDRLTLHGVVYASDDDTQMKIDSMLRNRDFKFYSIVVSDGNMVYEPMSVVSANHRESGETPDAFDNTIEFQEVLLAGKKPATSADPANESTKTH